jgi:MoaA/NifB/PqqE/SkfB family radical SAM enzyme
MPPPVLVNLESTLGCNLECVMCGSHMAGVTRKRQIMSPELLARVEAEVLPGARDLSLTVAGEPLMTPKLGTFIALAERQGLEREGELLDRLLRQSSVLKFSVDGARASTYESIRVQSDFELVIGNIRKAVAARARLPRGQRPRLAICMVLMRRNAEELVEMVELAHGLGVDRLEVAHLTVLSDELEPESLRHHPELCDQVLAQARRRADQLAFRLHLPPDMAGRPLSVAPSAQARLALRELEELSPRRLRRLGHRLQHKLRARAWELRAGGRVPCHFLQGGVFVTLGGDVAPCPMPGRPIAGNLLEQSFAQIWNGPLLSAMRQGFLEGRPFDCCAHCSQNPVNYQPADPRTARPPGYRPGLQERVY